MRTKSIGNSPKISKKLKIISFISALKIKLRRILINDQKINTNDERGYFIPTSAKNEILKQYIKIISNLSFRINIK